MHNFQLLCFALFWQQFVPRRSSVISVSCVLVAAEQAEIGEKVKPQDGDVRHYPYAVTVRIEGMTCPVALTASKTPFIVVAVIMPISTAKMAFCC